MKAIISRTNNGAWVRFIDKEPGESIEKEDMSYQFEAYQPGDDDVEGLAHMLWDILDKMGWSGGRHDAARIRIKIEHGDKFEHKDKEEEKECKICQEEKLYIEDNLSEAD